MQGKESKTNYLTFLAPVIVLAAALTCILIWPLVLFLPAIAIYLDLKSERPVASGTLLVAVAGFMLYMGQQVMFLMPLALFVGLMPLLSLAIMRMDKLKFFEGLAYAIAASLIVTIAGVVIVYFAYGQKDLVGMVVDGFKQWGLQASSMFDSVFEIFAMTSAYMESMVQGGALPDLGAIQAMTRVQHLELVVPMVRDMLTISGASTLMVGASLGGLFSWYLSLLAFGRRKTTKELPIKPPPFAVWRIHRSISNVLILLLFIAIILRLLGNSDMVIAGALALQNMVFAIITVQGIALRIPRGSRFRITHRWRPSCCIAQWLLDHSHQ